jgi:hypothetical protein
MPLSVLVSESRLSCELRSRVVDPSLKIAFLNEVSHMAVRLVDNKSDY